MNEPVPPHAETPEPSPWTQAAALVQNIQRGKAEAEAEFVRRYRRGVTVIVAPVEPAARVRVEPFDESVPPVTVTV